MSNPKRALLTIILLTWTGGCLIAQEFTESSLGFDPGEIEVITSPHPDDLKALVIPRYRGLLRLGKQNSYGLSANPRPQEIYRTQKERGALLNKKEVSVQRLFELMELHQRRADIDLQQIGSSFRIPLNARAQADDPARKNDYWSGQLKRMAPEYLQKNALAKYWCKEGEQCLIEGRQPGSYVSSKRSRPTWGGGTDEFAQLRAWQAYLNTEAPKILEWAGQLDEQEAYIVGTAYINEYDFNYEGFVIRVDAVEPKATRSTLITYPKIRDKDSFFARTEVNGNTLGGKLISMDPAKAEKLIERLESSDPRSREVYYVYKASIRLVNPEDTSKIYWGDPPKFIQEPSSNVVEFFLDEELKQKLFETDFSK